MAKTTSSGNRAALGQSFREAAAAVADPADIEDLRDSFSFDPENAEIRLGNRRMLLSDELGLAIMRRELIWALGHGRARGVISRIGYAVGVADAQFAQDVRRDGALLDIYRAGPLLHALKGAVRVEEVLFEADFTKGQFYGEYIWHNSAECHSHVKEMGVGTQPGGWQQCGYASGFASTFSGKPMIFREVECVAMGHDRCFVVGKPGDEWEDAEAELRWFRAENYNRRPPPGRTEPKTAPPQSERSVVGASTGFNTVLHLVDKVAPTQVPVLFMGESGVGKDVFARELHDRSRRCDGPFVALNCAAIPETLVEAELFGVERGAFTGADASRPGRFERAAGGTLFLDEIGTLSLAAQGKLLRVLQHGEFERVGGSKPRTADVRLIAATNADLLAGMEQGTFRADLYHRISTFPIRIPPLRERRGDIPVLAHHFLRQLSKRHGRSGTRFDADVIRCLHDYSWPGNIREMENLLERGVIVAEDDEPIGIHHLVPGGHIGQPGATDGAYRTDPFEVFVQGYAHRPSPDANEIGERLLDTGLSPPVLIDALMRATIERHNGNVSAAARALGITRAQVQYWKKNADTD